jgi:hypothetical protein
MTVGTQQEITLFLTEARALDAATEATWIDTVRSYLIERGIARWDDGTMDRGFKVIIFHKDGTKSFL